jgi:hypothetical protein
MVTLEDFISSTLIQIVNGAFNAQEQLKTSAEVAPPKENSNFAVPQLRIPRSVTYLSKECPVEFDVQITTSDETKSVANGGVKVCVLSGKIESTSNNRNENVNRVKFTIPIKFSPSEKTN